MALGYRVSLTFQQYVLAHISPLDFFAVQTCPRSSIRSPNLVLVTASLRCLRWLWVSRPTAFAGVRELNRHGHHSSSDSPRALGMLVPGPHALTKPGDSQAQEPGLPWCQGSLHLTTQHRVLDLSTTMSQAWNPFSALPAHTSQPRFPYVPTMSPLRPNHSPLRPNLISPMSPPPSSPYILNFVSLCSDLCQIYRRLHPL